MQRLSRNAKYLSKYQSKYIHEDISLFRRLCLQISYRKAVNVKSSHSVFTTFFLENTLFRNSCFTVNT